MMNLTIEELQHRQHELLQRLAAIRKDLRRGLDDDWKEQAIELENLDVLQEIARLAQQELNQVNHRLQALQEENPLNSD